MVCFGGPLALLLGWFSCLCLLGCVLFFDVLRNVLLDVDISSKSCNSLFHFAS